MAALLQQTTGDLHDLQQQYESASHAKEELQAIIQGRQKEQQKRERPFKLWQDAAALGDQQAQLRAEIVAADNEYRKMTTILEIMNTKTPQLVNSLQILRKFNIGLQEEVQQVLHGRPTV
eukprot:TRINITY_DN53593_c0_g1_i2.p1 TRINITY_DN53593_c0_g1~~TRINITY_DN53593_c0_g1_i2.p1  ORF type:complete len:120 (+),score=19.79 TRINITY_DN53593_c0_g1_i2:425-784(+)